MRVLQCVLQRVLQCVLQSVLEEEEAVRDRGVGSTYVMYVCVNGLQCVLHCVLQCVLQCVFEEEEAVRNSVIFVVVGDVPLHRVRSTGLG